MQKLFGTDGIRGQANTFPMDGETALLVGRAIARFFKEKRKLKPKLSKIVIGQDTRISGDMIARAVAAGICSAGVDVVLLGVLPTPGVAYMVGKSDAMAGIVISASHNPFADNGIKVFDEKGFKLSDEDEAQIEALMNDQHAPLIPPELIGRVCASNNANEVYINFLQQAARELSLQGLTIVLDCSNGATYQTAPVLFENLGANVVALFCSPDGVNINANCGSQYPQQLSREVVVQGAHLGLAFDGDGDRLIAVDETGNILTGDQIMVICAQYLLESNLLKNKAVVSTVMSNLGFHQALKRLNITSHITPVGDRYVIQKMLAEDAVLGGEDSGHMIFRDVHSTGDGLMAALRLLAAMQAAGQPLSMLTRLMTVYPQVLVNVDVKAKPAIETIPEIMAVIQKVENALGDEGRVLVRYSGTQKKCRVMVEGPTMEITSASCQEIVDVVRSVLGSEK